MTQALERWAAVRGYRNLYVVSSLGRVRSPDRVELVDTRWGGLMYRRRKGRQLATTRTAAGYLQVRLSMAGVATTRALHRVVLEAFVPKPKTGRVEVGHKNHRPGDNRLANLMWVTRQQNEDQKTNAGRRPRVTCSVLSDAAVRKIRALRAQGLTLQEIAAKVRCHYTTASLVCLGKSWRWVK